MWKLGEAAFAEVDTFAWVQRWQISRQWYVHNYRDRRFNALIACRLCTATGRGNAGKPCGECDGTGRVNLLEPPVRRPEQSSGGRP
ncbi:hypothetical protein JOL79_15155 [Microbispora sp. RL4-1S]|uniref:Uncharacterized protein n=2 Tax=Microbispora oryzae TaxID=2806554 RepID=A0A940WJN7_9ACTN|nr:hypothetical protein [Microbispora oryzae]